MKNKIILFLAIILFTGNVVKAEKNLEKILAQYNIHLKDIDDYKLIYNYPSYFKEKIIHMIVCEKDKLRLKMEIIRPCYEEEAKYISYSRKLSVEYLYKDYDIPYSGTITVTSECPEDKQAYEVSLKVKGQEYHAIVANASGDYIFGVWDETEIKNKGVMIFMHNIESKTLFNITVFQPYEDFKIERIITILEGFPGK